MKIGFFDSGLGGLTILTAVAKEMPEYDYLYYGDTINLPLGDKSESEIYEYAKAGVEYLFEHDCALVIIACNTASAETLRKLQDTYLFENFPARKILGVIIPTVETLIESKIENAVLIATTRTTNSGKYQVELEKQAIVHPTLTQIATPELVPLIESGKIENALSITKNIINDSDPSVGEVGGVILGCTHYTLLKEGLRESYGDKFIVFSQDEIIPKKLKKYLEVHTEIEKRLSQSGTRTIHLTSHRGDYDELAADFLGGRFITEE